MSRVMVLVSSRVAAQTGTGMQPWDYYAAAAVNKDVNSTVPICRSITCSDVVRVTRALHDTEPSPILYSTTPS